MNLLSRLLMRNVSRTQLAGFIISNIAGLAIIIAGLQLYTDVRPIWEDTDSFLKKDYLVINKNVSGLQHTGSAESSFSEQEIANLGKEPWVRSVGRFRAADYRVAATVGNGGGRSLSTYMFFESLPASYVDVAGGDWYFDPAKSGGTIPIIISKDYLALYNFGFAASAGMPQISENMLGSVPLQLTVSSDDGIRHASFTGRIAGFSNRLNTILVPEEFMEWASRQFGSGSKNAPSRLIIDVSSPGDAAIDKYMKAHGYEVAGDKSSSSAAYLVKVITMVIVSIGLVITLLSFFILLLSISLLMQKHRSKLRRLVFLGYPLSAIARPYYILVCKVTLISLVVSAGLMLLLRYIYLDSITSLGGGNGNVLLSLSAGTMISVLAVGFNLLSVRKRVHEVASIKKFNSKC